MRDIGGIVWFVVVFVGVVLSIVNSARRRTPPVAARRPMPPGPMQGAGPRAAPVPARAVVVPAAPPARATVLQARPAAAPAPAPAQPGVRLPEPPRERREAFLADKQAARRAIVAAEVLGKPLALRDE